MLGLKGNIDQGIRELEVASNDKLTGFEAKFFKLFIQSYILPINDRVRTEVNDFVQKNTDSELALFLVLLFLKRITKVTKLGKFCKKSKWQWVFAITNFRFLYSRDLSTKRKLCQS
jgi:hypothetical protein